MKITLPRPPGRYDPQFQGEVNHAIERLAAQLPGLFSSGGLGLVASRISFDDTGLSAISGADVQAALVSADSALNGKSNAGHTHDASAIVSGTLADARLPTTQAGKTFTSNITAPGVLAPTGSGTTLTLGQQTADAADDGRVIVRGGGGASNTRGAYAIFYGNEHATSPGQVLITSGINANVRIVGAGAGNISFESATGLPLFNSNEIWHDGNRAQQFHIHADAYGTVQEAIDAAAAAGRVLVFDGGTTYNIGATGATFPANMRVITNGCTFRVSVTSTSNAPWMVVSGNCVFDEIKIEVPATVRRDRCLSFTGDDIRVGKITVNSVDVQQTTESEDFAVRFLSCARLQVGKINIANYDRAAIFRSCSQAVVESVNISSYVRGVLVEDCTNLHIGPSHIHTTSPNASVSPGHNALLVNASADDATRNLSFVDWTIEGSGEHGIRLGGSFQVSNVYIVRPRIKNVGASGIKLQGDDGTIAANYHRRINVIDPIIEDCGDNGVNDCGIYFFLAVECNIVNPIIRKEGKTYSASYGIRIRSCVAVNIVNPTVLNAEFEGIWLDGSVNDNNQVTILGGRSALNGRDGLRVNYEQGTHRRFRAEGLLLEANGGYGCTISVNAGSGTLLDAYLNLVFEGNAAGTITSDTTATVLTARSDTAPAATTVRNGSTWQGLAGLYHRKAAAWVLL